MNGADAFEAVADYCDIAGWCRKAGRDAWD